MSEQNQITSDVVKDVAEGIADSSSSRFLLLESGDIFLLESGDKLILE